MYFKRIEIHGFKSFADPVIIEFKNGITCVVGPNGSGKSNISDAIRWVLGEQSPKTLRGGKMEEIIFSGTASRRQKGMAEVTLVIDNSLNILPIDYAEVAIRRRVFRSGESEYSINGSQCRLRDIRELIMDTGIGVDGYSIIGQGQIADIVSDKPESRREIFEEAAGIIKYKTQKAAAQRKLESANTNLERLNDIILDLEERLPYLREESAKAKEAAELNRKHKELEINIILRNVESIKTKNDTLKKDLEEADKALNSLRREKVELETDIASMRQRDETLATEDEETKEKIRDIDAKILKVKSNADLNEERQKSIEKDKARLVDEIANIQERVEKESQKKQQIEDKRKETEQQLAVLNMELDEKLRIAADAMASYDAHNQSIQDKKNEIFELSSEKSNKRTELNGNIELMSNFDSSKQQVKSNVVALKNQIENTESEIADSNTRLNTLEKELEELNSKREATEKEHTEASSEIAKGKEQAESLKLNIEKMLSRKHTIEEMENNYEGYNFGVRSLMKKNLAGIRGVVAELMDVPKGYETAIETALGAAMQNVVTDDDKSAKDAIEYLKSNRAGRVTFLPIKSMRKGSMKTDAAVTKEKGFDDYAVDKISFNGEYKDVFEYLLGNVIIVDNLANAVNISKKNKKGFKIVTVDGEVINAGGAMTGGRFKNKTADLLERKNEIDVLAKSIDEAVRKRDTLVDNLKNRMEVVSKILDSLKDGEANIRQKETEIISLKSDLRAANNKLEEEKKRYASASSELANIDTDKDKYTGMNDALSNRIDEIGRLIEKLEKEIEEELSTHSQVKDHSQQANDKVTEVKLKVAEMGANKENDDKAFAESGQALLTLEQELAEKLEEQKRLSGEEISLLSDSELEDIIKENEEQKRLAEEKSNGISIERMTIKNNIGESDIKQTNLEDKINSATERKYSMEIELGKQDTRLTNQKEKIYDEFEISYAEVMDLRVEDFVMTNAVKENRTIKQRLKELGEVNPGTIKEFEEVNERYEFHTTQRDDILKSMDDYNKIVVEMDRTSKTKFKESFDMIVENYDKFFKLLFGGGKGELRLEDENDPLECGIEITAQPPGKKIENINQTSGGEKTMIAIALMFAIIKTKPTPFCILDEIEAALDDNNIRRFADCLDDFVNTQFTLITHQKATMEYADVLYGVTMPEQGVTKVLSLELGNKETDEFAEGLEN